MGIGLLVLYCPPDILDGHTTLLGFDYNDVHARRISYAQESLSRGSLPPAWYTRELLGTPFRSNLQSCPLIPTRLGLLWFDPSALYPVAVNLAAILAALFTYLYCRAVGLGSSAAALAGWTFSASGFFAVRVLGGQLPHLEAFAALPLLLWILEHLSRAGLEGRIAVRQHVALALAVGCIALAGHPQIPSYAIAAALAYAVVRLQATRAARAALSIVLGLGLAAFAWIPMLHLIGRSTRVADLGPAANDVSLPFWRLKAFLLPWSDGWPSVVDRVPAKDFVDPNQAYFWDTVGYVGWVPLLAVLVLLGRALWKRRFPARPWVCMAILAISGLVLALPILPTSSEATGLTLLRSPARLLYLTTFALATALGAGVDLLARAPPKWRPLSWTCAAVLVGFHAVDLGTHDKSFVRTIETLSSSRATIEAARTRLADRRVAIDYNVYVPENRRLDDVGFFDSLMLLRPYRALLAMAGAPDRVNLQVFDGSILPERALAGLCVERVVTDSTRADLPVEASGVSLGTRWTAYAVANPARRAEFVPDRRVRFVEEAEILTRYRQGRFDLRGEALLPPIVRTADFSPNPSDPAREAVVAFDRPDPDQISIRANVPEGGYIRIVESWDEGWSATLDGSPAELVLSDAFAMAVRVTPGDRSIELCFRTPGATAGWILSALSAIGLLAFRISFRSGGPSR